jgi:hypothetical protein
MIYIQNKRVTFKRWHVIALQTIGLRHNFDMEKVLWNKVMIQLSMVDY